MESDAFLKEWRKGESCTIIDTAAINSIWPWQGVIEKECRAKKMSLTLGSELHHCHHGTGICCGSSLYFMAFSFIL